MLEYNGGKKGSREGKDGIKRGEKRWYKERVKRGVNRQNKFKQLFLLKKTLKKISSIKSKG
jgi:hypothetical protein